MQETWIQSLGQEDALEKGKATHSSILAWRIPWIVQSMGSQRVRHDWETFTSPHLNFGCRGSKKKVRKVLGRWNKILPLAHFDHRAKWLRKCDFVAVVNRSRNSSAYIQKNKYYDDWIKNHFINKVIFNVGFWKECYFDIRRTKKRKKGHFKEKVENVKILRLGQGTACMFLLRICYNIIQKHLPRKMHKSSFEPKFIINVIYLL